MICFLNTILVVVLLSVRSLETELVHDTTRKLSSGDQPSGLSIEKRSSVHARSTSDGDRFLVDAVAQCTSIVKFPTDNHYKLDAAGADKYMMCRVLGQSTGKSQAYTMSAELLNQAGWLGINSGHPGVLLNAADKNNFDFVYFK